MSLASFFDLFANKIESFFDESEYDNKYSEKKLAKLEKKIYSQDNFASKKYKDFLTNIDESAFEIADFAIKESLKNRIAKDSDLFALKEILSDQDIDDFIKYSSLNIYELPAYVLVDNTGSYNSEIASFFISCVQDIRNHLKGKRIVKLLTSFISKKHHSLNLLYLQIHLRSSFLAFFDQLFAYKDVEQNLSFERNILFYVNVKNSNNETRRINRFVPAFSGT